MWKFLTYLTNLERRVGESPAQSRQLGNKCNDDTQRTIVKFPSGIWQTAQKVYAHTHKQCIFRPFNNSTFGTVHFDENPFTCQRDK